MPSNPGMRFLNESGFNLVAILNCASLPAAIQAQLTAENLAVADYSKLVLLGSSGSRVWNQLQAEWMERANPFDEYAIAVVDQYIEEHLDGAPSHLFYPGTTRVSLMGLGEMAGWSHSSPLGLGIHAVYGLWFAYRAAFVTSADLTPTPPYRSQHPCESCADKPCVSACPVNAVKVEETFDISGCYNFRVSENSPCVAQCFARLACPVGAEHQYPPEQIQHHYDLNRRVE